MYNLEKRLSAFLDISTYCNAACPQCHRTDRKGLGKIDWLPLIFWDLDKFKRAFSPKDVLRHYQFIFCGTWGDPVMNPHLDKILDYVNDNSLPDTDIIINTNGSIRDEDWWYKLGLTHGKKLTVVFAVDGSTQEMHEKYRKKTNLQKVLNNMEALSETDSVAKAMTIIFKHNENYLKDIALLVQQYGAIEYSGIPSNRFEGIETSSWVYMENDEMNYLERITENKVMLKEKDVKEILPNVDNTVIAQSIHLKNPYFHVRLKRPIKWQK